MTVLSSLGYCRIGSVISERAPTRSMSRLTTSDSTGRRMKMSVKNIRRKLLARAGSMHRHGGGRGQRISGRRDRCAVDQLELAGGGDAVARLEARKHRDLVVEMLAGGDEAALDAIGRSVGGAGGVLGDDEDAVAIEGVMDRGLRPRHDIRVVR